MALLKWTTTIRPEGCPAVSHVTVQRKIIGLNCFAGGFRRNKLMCRQQLMMMYDIDNVAK